MLNNAGSIAGAGGEVVAGWRVGIGVGGDSAGGSHITRAWEVQVGGGGCMLIVFCTRDKRGKENTLGVNLTRTVILIDPNMVISSTSEKAA
jgi:hypothetical protein